jgi:uncharacterized membrane protein YhhN
VALLIAERTGSRLGVWLAKPAASVGFVTFAWLGDAAATPYGRALLVALVLCALGDVLLIPRATGIAFLAGMLGFALGHGVYAWAFQLRDTHWWSAWLGLAAIGLIVGLTLRWLGPHLPAEMRWPIRIYMLVIALMVALAIGSSVGTGDLRLGLGAIAFAASDLSVARERFVRPAFGNLLWGLPLYYAAQLVLGWSAAT